MKKMLLKGLPHFIAVFVFVLLGAIYFAPQFNGYDLNQSDIRQYRGMSKEIADFRETEKKEPLWTNAAFGGMPTYQISMVNPNMMISIEDFVVFRMFNIPFGYLVVAMLSFYILLLCFDVNPWLSIVGAIAFGFSSIFVLYLAGGHNSKVHAIALLPGIIGSLIYAYRKNFRIGGLLLCVFLCLHLSANHIQETYYLVFLVLAIVITEGYLYFKQHQFPAFIKISTFLLFAALIGIIPTLSNLLLTNEYSKSTNRGKSDLTISASQSSDNSEAKGLDRDYIKQYSFGYGEVWSLVVPNIKGGASNSLGNFPDKLAKVAPENQKNIAGFPSYWGEQSSTGGAFYFGATIFLLFVLGMIFIKDKIKWAFFATSVLAILLSWKYSSVLDFFIDYVPLFNKFRDTKMILVLVQISFPLLGLLFLNQILNTKINQKKLLLTMGATIGLFFLFYLFPSLGFSFINYEELNYFEGLATKYPQALDQIHRFQLDVEKVRILIFKADVLRSIIFMILIAGVILLFTRQKIAKGYFIVVVGILVLTDLWLVDKRYLNNDLAEQHWIKKAENSIPYSASIADIQILKWEMADSKSLNNKINQKTVKVSSEEKENIAFSTLNLETDYRVFSLDNPFANASTSYYHKSIGGYHAAKLKRYVELTDFRLNKEYQILVNAVKSRNDSLIDFVLHHKIPALNMLNTRYIIFDNDTTPIRNPYANGAAWIVRNVDVVKNANEEIKALDSINPAHTAIVDHFFGSCLPHQLDYDTMATVTLNHYQPNYLSYVTSSQTEQVCVFSEIYYKDGWKAYVDGKLSPYFRADYVLRAMTIPGGKHTIEFKFEPDTYYIAKKLSFAGSVLMVFFALGVLFYEIYQYRRSV